MTERLGTKPIWIAAFSALAVAVLGGLMTDIGPWYRGLVKPSFQPPDYLFGPAWTIIFSLTAIAGVMAWNASHSRRQKTSAFSEWLLGAFALNGFLNLLWSLLFFRLRRPDWALIEVFFLLASIVLLMMLCAKASKRAALLLIPYLLWVCFASLINWKVVELNAPF